MSPRELATMLTAWGMSTSVLLLWVHRTKQEVVPRTWPRSRMIALRTGVLFALAHLVFVGALGLPVAHVSAVTTLVVLLLPVISLGALEGADSAGALAVLALIIMPLFALRQYILGNPEMDDIVLTPPTGGLEQASNESLPEGTQATVVTALRPTGYVDVAGRRAQARSHDGRFVEVGSVVQVHSRLNRQLVVRVTVPHGSPKSGSAPSATDVSNFDGQPNPAAPNDS